MSSTKESHGKKPTKKPTQVTRIKIRMYFNTVRKYVNFKRSGTTRVWFGLVGFCCLLRPHMLDPLCVGGRRVEKESKQEKKKAALLFSLIATQSPPGTRFFGQIQQQPNATS